MNTKNQKEQLRKKFLKKRLALKKAEIVEKSEKIMERIISLKEFKEAEKICIYYPIKKEVNLLNLKKLFPKKTFFLPKIENETLYFGHFKIKKNLKTGPFGIKEPPTTTKNLIPDIIFSPGLTFDLQKNRIGYGKGYFDEFIKNIRKISKKTKIIGIAFEFQVLKKTQIITTRNDQKQDLIITEKNIYQ
ncbi:MAG: 5-formyltetrahydrofolate cyclo-ligase [Candidatus Gracilibacteria bacterium]|jgi:5-formyltetrahydrofolate cyclo-ligase|nr:5-formyltetrahydrofolate cyclo-ligase [Candidatus Gracilibacteria bacterium]